MKVYKSEVDAGLAKIVRDECRVNIACKIEKSPVICADLDLTKIMKSLADADRDDFDLYPVRTIMVSTGWNGNDDIFDQSETWAARHSPVNKPFNLGHVPKEIIGHIIASHGVDDSFDVIDDNIAAVDLPSKFHVITDAVIYRHLGGRDPQLTQEIANIIAGIENGNWYVSMECLFNGFDYGLRHIESGKQIIVARQEDTAFLTKHLRRYNGSGTYNDYSVGRVLRNITFVGKGLVENPANPESIFLFDDVASFAGSMEDETFIMSQSEENDNMSDELKSQVADLQRQLAEANSRLREMDEEVVKTKLDTKDAEIAKRDENITKLGDRITELETQYNEASKELSEANEAKSDIVKRLDEATSKLDAIEAKARKTDRVSILVDKGVDKSDAEDIVEKFNDLVDEKFDIVVSMQADLIKAKTHAEDKNEEDNETQASEDGDESTADLDEANEESDVDMTAADESAAETRNQQNADLSKFVGTFLIK